MSSVAVARSSAVLARIDGIGGRWGARLFLPAAARPRDPVLIGTSVVAVLAAAAVSLLRQRGYAATNTIWAEDGAVFLTDALRLPFWRELVAPYNGYFQFLPRLLIEPVVLFPAAWAAAVIAIEAALVNALFALVVFVASGAALRRVPLRLLAALVAVLPALGTQEALNSLANVHWAGLYAFFWTLLWVPATRAGRVVAIVVTFSLSFTNVLVLVLVPLALMRVAARRREPHTLTLAGILLAGLVTHGLGLTLGASHRVYGSGQPSAITPIPLYFRSVLPSYLIGDGPIFRAALHGARLWPIMLVGWVLVLAFLGFGVLRGRAANWPLATVAIATSAITWWVAAGSSGQPASRYIECSGMIFVSALLALLAPAAPAPASLAPAFPAPAPAFPAPAGAPTGWRARWAPWVPRLVNPAIAALGVILVVALAQAFFSPPSNRGQGPAWNEGVAAARAACARPAGGASPGGASPGGASPGGASAGGASADGTVGVPISPPGWLATLPCAALA